MSVWTQIEARFSSDAASLDARSLLIDAPTGSERGLSEPIRYRGDGGYWFTEGRLRDFADLDAPAALAWFLGVCQRHYPTWAELLIDVDSGPRYRYRWQSGALTKLRGVLD